MASLNGMKVYDTKWFLAPYYLSYQQAAELLAQQNIDFILTQNHFLPMPNTAVESEISDSDAKRFACYQDLAFREALAQTGIDYYMSCLMFFDPPAMAKGEAQHPIDKHGTPMSVEDWYIGITPTQQPHLANKISKILHAVNTLQPDGLHLGFMRWPGFWELYLPDKKLSDFVEYGFDELTIDLFLTEHHLTLPKNIHSPAEIAHWISHENHPLWVAWKCQVIHRIIYDIAKQVKQIKPDIKIILNTLPFTATDFDGAILKMFGQDLALLADVVDVFEIMAYHQILKQTIHWPAAIANHVKSLTGKDVIVTLQAQALYLDGIHRNEGRNPVISDREFKQLVTITRDSLADACVFFQWTDFLQQQQQGNNIFIDIVSQK